MSEKRFSYEKECYREEWWEYVGTYIDKEKGQYFEVPYGTVKPLVDTMMEQQSTIEGLQKRVKDLEENEELKSYNLQHFLEWLVIKKHVTDEPLRDINNVMKCVDEFKEYLGQLESDDYYVCGMPPRCGKVISQMQEINNLRKQGKRVHVFNGKITDKNEWKD